TLYLTEIAARAIDPNLGIEGKRRRGPAFQIWARIDEGAERGNDVGWLAEAGPERLCIDIADIIIMSGLAPGPAALFLVNAENLTEKQWGVHGRIGLGAMQQRGAWHLDLPVFALDEAGGSDLATQIGRRNIIPVRIETAIQARAAAHVSSLPAVCITR